MGVRRLVVECVLEHEGRGLSRKEVNECLSKEFLGDSRMMPLRLT
jgi:hypothetical protein